MESGVIWQHTFTMLDDFSCCNWHIIKFSGRSGGKQGERKGRIPASHQSSPSAETGRAAQLQEYSYPESCLSLTSNIKQGLHSVVSMSNLFIKLCTVVIPLLSTNLENRHISNLPSDWNLNIIQKISKGEYECELHRDFSLNFNLYLWENQASVTEGL